MGFKIWLSPESIVQKGRELECQGSRLMILEVYAGSIQWMDYLIIKCKNPIFIDRPVKDQLK